MSGSRRSSQRPDSEGVFGVRHPAGPVQSSGSIGRRQSRNQVYLPQENTDQHTPSNGQEAPIIDSMFSTFSTLDTEQPPANVADGSPSTDANPDVPAPMSPSTIGISDAPPWTILVPPPTSPSTSGIPDAPPWTKLLPPPPPPPARVAHLDLHQVHYMIYSY